MANTTVKGAKILHGTNPQFLIERVIRGRIYDSMYWKEQCFALTAESLVDKAVSLTYIGGTYGIERPTSFLCLVCKLLQLQPTKEIILEYLQFDEFKYLRAIVAMYVRLAFTSLEVYEILEPMLNDYRKLRFREMSGSYHITFMDEFIYDLLTKERVCELILPRLTKRDVLEDTEGLAPRISKLEDALLAEIGQDDSDAAASDDSAAIARKVIKDRRDRAQRIRQDRELQGLNRLKAAQDGALEDRQEGLIEDELASQEEEESQGYISGSPSASGSERGYQSRSPSRSPDRRDGYISRSISPSPSASPNTS